MADEGWVPGCKDAHTRNNIADKLLAQLDRRDRPKFYLASHLMSCCNGELRSLEQAKGSLAWPRNLESLMSSAERQSPNGRAAPDQLSLAPPPSHQTQRPWRLEEPNHYFTMLLRTPYSVCSRQSAYFTCAAAISGTNPDNSRLRFWLCKANYSSSSVYHTAWLPTYHIRPNINPDHILDPFVDALPDMSYVVC